MLGQGVQLLTDTGQHAGAGAGQLRGALVPVQLGGGAEERHQGGRLRLAAGVHGELLSRTEASHGRC